MHCTPSLEVALPANPKRFFFEDNEGILEAITDLGMKIKLNG